MAYEYKIVPAPERGLRRRGLRTPGDRIAAAMEEILAEEAVDGWEYLRADVLPVVEKAGFLSREREVERAMLVFRRALGGAEGAETVRAPRAARPAGPTEPSLGTELSAEPAPRREPQTGGFLGGQRQGQRGVEPQARETYEPQARETYEPQARGAPAPRARREDEPQARRAGEPRTRRGDEPSPRHEPAPQARPEPGAGRRRSAREEAGEEGEAPRRDPYDFSDIRDALRKLDR